MHPHKTKNIPFPEFFNLSIFQEIANLRTTNPSDFAKWNIRRSRNPGKVYHFGVEPHACLIDRGSRILMVAHVDTVIDTGGLSSVSDSRLHHPAIDNRLGVYLGLHLLPLMGLDCDLLLSTDEEVGASTAAAFRPNRPHHYHWMFSFDRGGEDLVLYQYTCDALISILKKSGFVVGKGTYSCISELTHLGIAGVNFGAGMHDYHTPDAYCDLRQLNRQLLRFKRFYVAHAHHHLPYRGLKVCEF